METAPLKSFATGARTSLIREVTARVTAVLAPGSTERVEQPAAVAALEKAIHAAGGGDKGRASVADTVAYTWFNRIVALRFMDANGYTGIGVVSPQVGVDVGQPEVLAQAKRGVIDTEVMSLKTRTTVIGLLDGSRASTDPQGEAYALLLADYCRHWNKVMPFMFEQEGDFTELLIPANLLADDSVLNQAVKVLTESVCQDVEVIGWLYQFYISEKKDEVFAGFKKGKKAGAEEIPAATQLFTPDWIVRYLVENSLGRLWMLNRPASRLVDQMHYFIAPVDGETDFIKVAGPEELMVIDPACGSGHMLTYAFDLLYAIYEEEGYSPVDIPSLILTHNLFGTEIDSRAGALAAFALVMKARSRQRTFFSGRSEPRIRVLHNVRFTSEEIEELATSGGDRLAEEDFWRSFEHSDTFGSLVRPDETQLAILRMHVGQVRKPDELFTQDLFDRAEQVLAQAEFLSQRYHVVVTNPPYMGSGNMGDLLSNWAVENYPLAKADLFAMFIERGFLLALPAGYSAMVTMQSWMFLASFEQLRLAMLSERTVASLMHMGNMVMGIAFGTVATVWRTTRVTMRADYQFVEVADLADGQPKSFPVLSARSKKHEQSRFLNAPGAPIAYWLSDFEFDAFSAHPPLQSAASASVGMATGDNAKFVRMWFEVGVAEIGFGLTRPEAKESNKRWFPYAKGGESRRWYGNFREVVLWHNDGEILQTEKHSSGRIRAHNFNLSRIFKESLFWTVVTASGPTFRYAPQGALFDAAAGILQPTVAGPDIRVLLAYLNSGVAKRFLSAINPTVNLHPGYIEAIPFPDCEIHEVVVDLANEAVSLSRERWDRQEVSWDFDGLSQWPARDQRVEQWVSAALKWEASSAARIRSIEARNDEIWREAVVGSDSGPTAPSDLGDTEQADYTASDLVADLLSYAVGCMFGRYSLDELGLVLADQGATLQDYLARIPSPTFMPDVDNVIPIVDGDWFEDDIVERFRQFLRAAFGEQHFEENLRFVVESLGVKSLRDYFVKSFYKDHIQRYKKRPIYWLFSSPNGSFNALIYMHRYTPSTVSTVLNEYLREFQAKLKASLEHAERSNNAKEADRLRKILLELDGYEHDVLYPLASQNIAIDLDDGVKVNYPKFGAALKKIPGLEASE